MSNALIIGLSTLVLSSNSVIILASVDLEFLSKYMS